MSLGVGCEDRRQLARCLGSSTRVAPAVGSEDMLAFELPVGEWVVAGDEVTVTAGCDRRFSTCKAKFANGVSFRGFPHIPGNDFVLKVPKEGAELDGQALFE